jgi:hypothetical protein
MGRARSETAVKKDPASLTAGGGCFGCKVAPDEKPPPPPPPKPSPPPPPPPPLWHAKGKSLGTKLEPDESDNKFIEEFYTRLKSAGNSVTEILPNGRGFFKYLIEDPDKLGDEVWINLKHPIYRDELVTSDYVDYKTHKVIISGDYLRDMYIGKYEISDDNIVESLINKYGLLAIKQNNAIHLWLPYNWLIGIKCEIDDIKVITDIFGTKVELGQKIINFGNQANLATKMQAAIDKDLGINEPSGGARRATIMFIKDGKTHTRKVHVNSRGTMCVKFANALIPISKLKKL